MPLVRCSPEADALFLIDIQTKFMEAVHEADRVLDRALFLLRIARILGVPVIVTEQAPDKLGSTDERLLAELKGVPIHAKSSFSCAGCPGAVDEWKRLARPTAILVGVETHICVSTTAHDLLSQGAQVVVCPDAVSSRTLERHKLGMERIRDAGVVPAHSESIAYEWLGSASNPHFRDALAVVKSARF